MEDRVTDLYRVPNVEQYEDTHLQTLWECCAEMEERVNTVLERLSVQDRQIIEAYIDMRNELEFQSIKTALRWGKQHYK